MSAHPEGIRFAERGLPSVAGSSEAAAPPSPCAAVVLFDQSRSMFLRELFTPAKEAAIALNSLIREQYPRVALYLVGFSYYVKEHQPEELPGLEWNNWGYGTNMQQAFMLSRQLLAPHNGPRQILLITDGEPTAYLEQGQIEFTYPPTPRVFEMTLREVERCANERIVIITFMLERAPRLIEFVEQMATMTHGRVFHVTPERLAEDIATNLPTLGLSGADSS